MTVSGHHLRGDRFSGQAQAAQNPGLEVRRGGRIGAHRAGYGAYSGLGKGPLEPVGVAGRLEGEPGQLDPERGRLGVDAVRAPYAQGPHVRAGLLGESLGEAAGIGEDNLADPLEL